MGTLLGTAEPLSRRGRICRSGRGPYGFVRNPTNPSTTFMRPPAPGGMPGDSVPKLKGVLELAVGESNGGTTSRLARKVPRRCTPDTGRGARVRFQNRGRSASRRRQGSSRSCGSRDSCTEGSMRWYSWSCLSSADCKASTSSKLWVSSRARP